MKPSKNEQKTAQENPPRDSQQKSLWGHPFLEKRWYYFDEIATPPLSFTSRKHTYTYNFDPLKPHFYVVKLGWTGVYIFFLISAKNIDCRYLLEPSR